MGIFHLSVAMSCTVFLFLKVLLKKNRECHHHFFGCDYFNVPNDICIFPGGNCWGPLFTKFGKAWDR